MNINKAFNALLRFYRVKDYKNAERICKEILQRKKKNVDVLHALGVIYFEQGMADLAETYVRKAIRLEPSFADAWNNLGNILQQKKKFDEAITAYREALRINSGLPQTYFNLGIAFQEKGRFHDAVNHYKQAIQKGFTGVGVYNNMGLAYHETGQLDEAEIMFGKAIEIHPGFAEAQYNLGNILRDKKLMNKAVDAYRKAFMVNPEYADAHWNLSQVLLMLGDFQQGWEEYEWRWRLEGNKPRVFSQPLWDGSDIRGKTILLHTEQGFGDAIQFIRYAPLVSERGARVVVECQRELAEVFRGVAGVEQVVIQGEDLPEFDLSCPLLSLPRLFDTDLGNIPAGIPYIRADHQLREKWKGRVQREAGLKAGLVWAGGPRHKKDRYRSCSLEVFAPLGAVEGVIFYSLQKGEAAGQVQDPPRGMNLVDHTDEIGDFSDTAALIENLDVVISVDTAVAHLAGALGRPVWTLIPYAPDWRWMLDREDSPWYPTMRLFRQPVMGDWATVIGRVHEAFQELCREFSGHMTS